MVSNSVTVTGQLLILIVYLTTVDTVALQDENSSFTTVTSPETWVGGAAAENQAVMGMALNKQGTKTTVPSFP